MNQHDLSFEYFAQLKKQSSGLRLLSADHFPLLAGFFHKAFIRSNRRSIPYQELIGQLDIYLLDINEQHKNPPFPKTARAYIDDWINLKGGYLRKYMPAQGDEPECDLLPDVEKALRWLEELQGRKFVGTESRLKLLLDLISELAHDTSDNREKKIAQLKKQKAELEQQLLAVEQGLEISLTDTQVTERMYLIADMSRQLLGDFRRIDANFRELDLDTRKQITQGGQLKGKVLEQVFSGQDVIDESDEGRSFSAFFELLMTPSIGNVLRQELQQLLDVVYIKNDSSDNLALRDELLNRLYTHLLDAGQQVSQTRQQINEQLRRYIQEQSQDNRRILELIRQFESKAQQVQPEANMEFAQLDGFSAEINQILSRRLYQANEKELLNSEIEEAASEQDVDMSALFEVSQIDEQQLLNQVAHTLSQHRGQATLAQIAESHPIEYGLDEVLSYLKLACEQAIPAHIDSEQSQILTWESEPGKFRRLTVPLVTFSRSLS